MDEDRQTKNSTKDVPPKTKEAFVNDQVTKFFEMPFKDKSTKSDQDIRLTIKELAPTPPLFQKTIKADQKYRHSKANLEKPTSPAITVTSWEETNKGQDEFTHASHIRHNTSIDPHHSHISGENHSKSYKSIMGNKDLYEDEQNLELMEESGKVDDDDSLSNSPKFHEDHKKINQFHDSLSNSVSPTGYETSTPKPHDSLSLNEDLCKDQTDDSLERHINDDKNNVDMDSLVDMTTGLMNRNTINNSDNAGGYFDSLSNQEGYNVTEFEQNSLPQNAPLKKKLILPTSISFNDSFSSSDTSPFHTSLDASIDSVNNSASAKKGGNGSTLDSLEHQIKSGPAMTRIQNGITSTNTSLDPTIQVNHTAYHRQLDRFIQPLTSTQYGNSDHGVNAINKPVTLSRNILDPLIPPPKPSKASSVSSNQANANVQRPILSNTNRKTITPYYGYSSNVNIYDTATNHVEGAQINNNRFKPPTITSTVRHHSPLVSRSQSQPAPHFSNDILPTDHLEENIINCTKGNSIHRPVSPKVLGIPTVKTASHQNQSVVKIAAEKMKRKFLGWS